MVASQNTLMISGRGVRYYAESSFFFISIFSFYSLSIFRNSSPIIVIDPSFRITWGVFWAQTKRSKAQYLSGDGAGPALFTVNNIRSWVSFLPFSLRPNIPPHLYLFCPVYLCTFPILSASLSQLSLERLEWAKNGRGLKVLGSKKGENMDCIWEQKNW